jgi:hypothetical protein
MKEVRMPLIGKMTSQGDVQSILENFKSCFASAAGYATSWSSDAGWAQTDLSNAMGNAESNAPMFIEAFYDGCEQLKKSGMAAPHIGLINRILAKHEAGYEIRPPKLIALGEFDGPVLSTQPAISLDQQARDVIDASLRRSGELLTEGRYRPAVQEVLWLLETVATAFQGVSTDNGTVQGKYFNRIVGDLRSKSPGTTLALVLEWCTTLHGYLSSPTGGGVRHGTHVLKAELDIQPHEATLFCNLTRSYIFYLIAEHARLTGTQRILE